MPVGLVRKWTLVALLGAAVAVTACKDDDADEPVDSGGPGGGTGGSDAGTPGGGGMDSSTPSDGGGTGGGSDAAKDSGAASIMCGSLSCTGHTTAVATFEPGCTTDYMDATVCGISTKSLLDGGEPKFLEKNAPGVAAPGCAIAVDMGEPTPDGGAVDGGPKGNGKIDTVLMLGGLTIGLSYPGCCTPSGWCSANTDMGKASIAGMAPTDSVGGFGCMDPKVFFRTVDGGVALPCNPETGALMLDAGGGGSPEGGAGDGGGDDAGAADASGDT